MLARLLQQFGPVADLGEADSRALWREIRDVKPFAATGNAADRPLWRISTAPSKGAEVANLVGLGAQMFYDWGGGLLWVAMPPKDDAGTHAIHRAVQATGGHATLVRAPLALRAKVDVFPPQDTGVAALTKRVKDSFDPKGVLNPGRMWAGV